MEQLWNTITAGAGPLIVSALAMLIPAVTAYAVAWLKAQAALQEQAVRNAVNHVDALRSPAVDISGAEAKAMALRLVAAQLPKVSEKLQAKLSEKIQAVVDEKRRSVPPALTDDAAPTARHKRIEPPPLPKD